MESILVLEDDTNLRELIGDTLEDAGYEVHLSSHAIEAIEAARQRTFHLILSDVRMAGEYDGVGAIEQIKKFRPHIRSVIMTGYASLEVPVRAAHIQADDYLLKGDSWFGVRELLETLRRVLDRQVQSSGWLSRVLQMPTEIFFKTLRGAQEARLLDLSHHRERFYQRFYLLIRPGHLSKEAAYPIYLELEKVEAQYRLATSGSYPKLDLLSKEYSLLEKRLLATGLPWSEDARFTLAQFGVLYEKVRQGQVDLTQFQQACRLRSDDKARLENAESYALYHWIWSQAQEEDDAFVGLKLGPYQLQERVPGALQKVRFYQATHRERGQDSFWVICLPIDQENRGIVEIDKQHTLAVYWEEIYGCYFTVFDKQTLTLKYQIPADGLTPKQTWQLLDPVFFQVGRFHREQRYSGGFALSDIHKLPSKPAYLLRFDDKAFRAAQNWQKTGRGVNFCFAPEAPHSQGPPTAAADQAVLGRLFIEVVLGQGLHPIPPLMLHQMDQERISNLWLSLGRQLGPCQSILHRMCQPDPQRRFPTLGEAYVQLRKALS